MSFTKYSFHPDKENTSVVSNKTMHNDKESPFLTKQNSLNSSVISSYEIVEDDISKIAKSYVLDNGRLRLKSIKYGNGKSQNISTNPANYEQKAIPAFDGQTISRKEMIKLEYLQKAGFLNEQQRRVLVAARNKHLPATSLPYQYQPSSDPSQSRHHYQPNQVKNLYPHQYSPFATPNIHHHPELMTYPQHYGHSYDLSYEAKQLTDNQEGHPQYY